MSLKDFEKAKEKAEKNPGIVTKWELQILQEYMLKDVKSVAKTLGITPQVVYRVFQRIRQRRKRSQQTVNFWNDFVKQATRLRNVLTPKIDAPEQEEE